MNVLCLRDVILTEFTQLHVRDHLEDGTPQSGLLPSAADTDTMRGKGTLPKASMLQVQWERLQLLLSGSSRSLIFH